MKKVIIVLFFGIAIGIYTKSLIEYEKIIRIKNSDVIMKIEIETEYINVRKHPNTQSKKIHEVYEDEIYEVIEKLTADYDWYKIKFSNKRTGWIASNEWVKEL